MSTFLPPAILTVPPERAPVAVARREGIFGLKVMKLIERERRGRGKVQGGVIVGRCVFIPDGLEYGRPGTGGQRKLDRDDRFAVRLEVAAPIGIDRLLNNRRVGGCLGGIKFLLSRCSADNKLRLRCGMGLLGTSGGLCARKRNNRQWQNELGRTYTAKDKSHTGLSRFGGEVDLVSPQP